MGCGAQKKSLSKKVEIEHEDQIKESDQSLVLVRYQTKEHIYKIKLTPSNRDSQGVSQT